MMANKQEIGKDSIKQRYKKTTSCVMAGLLIGFLAAAVVYSNLPGWVPGFLSQKPGVFFSLFMVICAALGYFWAITPEEAETKKRPPLFNVMLSGAFIGFLATAVFYSKYQPTWLPFFFSAYPVFVFIGTTLIGAFIGFLWHRTTASN